MGEDRQRYENVVDRKGWPAGPWDDEPLDKAVWIDDDTDLDCMIVRGPMGAWCGYIGLTREHPFYGMNAFEVPGGDFNYSATCDEKSPEEESICHVPAPGRSGDVWWLGFDLAHAWDIAPGMLAASNYFKAKYLFQDPEAQKLGIISQPGDWIPTTYKNEAFVRKLVTDYAKELKALCP